MTSRTRQPSTAPAARPPFRHIAIAASLLLCTAGTAPLAAQSGGRLVPAADLQADATLLRRAYETLHPGLRRYNTPEQLERHWAALQQSLGHDQTQAEAYLAFSRLTAAIRCGHSYPNFYNQSDSLIAALLGGTHLVPFEFRWIDRRMIVTRSSAGDARLPAGTEVLSIDGVPAATILDSLVTVTRADGSNDAKRIHLLEVQGIDRYETFDIYHHLFFPPKGATFRLEVRRPGARTTERLDVTPVTQAEREGRIAATLAARRGADSIWTYRYLDSTTAYLRMDSWAMYNSTWDWKPWLEGRMADAAAHARTLVVDLRRNEGGNDVGNVILAHLVDRPLTITSIKRMVRYRRVPDDLNPYLATWDKSFRDWGEAAQPAADGFYRLQRYDDGPDGDVIAPAGPRFAGRVVVLVGPENSSATFQFAQVVQQHRLGTLLGLPTGGNQRGINGGAFFFLRLPKSGIEVDVPLIAYFPPGDVPDAGLTPDLTVPARVEDVTTGRDAELDATLLREFTAERFAARVAGAWTGALVYRDFSSEKLVELPTELRVERPGPATLRFAYAWDDGPGKLIRDTAMVRTDVALRATSITGAGYGEQGEYAIAAATGFAPGDRGTPAVLTLLGRGTDGDLPVEVRLTITMTDRTLAIRRDTRAAGGSFALRHEYRFTRGRRG